MFPDVPSPWWFRNGLQKAAADPSTALLPAVPPAGFTRDRNRAGRPHPGSGANTSGTSNSNQIILVMNSGG